MTEFTKDNKKLKSIDKLQMMEFIRTIREKQQTARQENIAKEAEEVITLSDFANTLFIAYHGTPLIQIDDNATPKDIVQQLSVIRNNYINAKIKDNRGIAAL